MQVVAVDGCWLRERFEPMWCTVEWVWCANDGGGRRFVMEIAEHEQSKAAMS